MSTLVGYIHLIAVFALGIGLVIENMAIKPLINAEDARNLARVDAVCGLSVLIIVLCGLALWLWIGKPSSFYSLNPVFHAKLGFFVLLLAMAIYPAQFFFRNRKSTAQEIAVPKAILVLLKLELALLFVIPMLAFLMARGIGLIS